MRSIPSVLVIDDNAATLKIVGKLLATVGVKTVREVHSAEEALVVLATEKFSAIVADYRLGGMDGVEFIESLRRRGDQTPVLLISGALDEVAVARASRQPKVDFFHKPFRLADLLAAMERLAVASEAG